MKRVAFSTVPNDLFNIPFLTYVYTLFSDVELSYENLEENLKKIISKQDYDKIIQMSKGDLEQVIMISN